jgi:hypothetical protein
LNSHICYWGNFPTCDEKYDLKGEGKTGSTEGSTIPITVLFKQGGDLLTLLKSEVDISNDCRRQLDDLHESIRCKLGKDDYRLHWLFR